MVYTMKKKALSIVILLSLMVAISCDKDFNEIGSDIIGNGNFIFEKYSITNLTAISKRTGDVQSNNLPVNHLGVYNDYEFGTTKASFVTQVALETESPIIGDVQQIDSVYLYVPYFNTLKETATDGSKTYELDSVYGFDESATFRLNVFENGYFIRNFDPSSNFQSAQKYYTNDNAIIDSNKKSVLLNNSSNINQNENFFINDNEILIYKTNGSGQYIDAAGLVLTNQGDLTLRVVKERKVPGIWLDLDKNEFQDILFGAVAKGKLLNNAVFKEYFRGLYFKTEETSPGRGSMATLDFNKAELKVLYKRTVYKRDDSGNIVLDGSSNPDVESLTRQVLSFKMGSSSAGCNSINLIENDFSADFNAGVSTTDGVNLYLKGGNGSIVYIDLPVSEIESLRTENWLVNEANLTFYINTTKMGAVGQIEPERIYLFDATNNTPILDYYLDQSTNSTDIKKSKLGLGGIIEKSELGEKKGVKYKIRLTSLINKMINGDDDENEIIRLGLVVTENINIFNNGFIFDPATFGTDTLPFGSIMSPLGTVLYGPNSTATYTDGNGDVIPMKLKLDIYYTKPN